MQEKKTVFIVGATRGIGLALAKEFIARGWDVIGTARGENTPLHALAENSSGKLRIENLDITEEAQIEILKTALRGTSLDILFVNAGIGNKGGMSESIADVTTEDFTNVMVTNTFAPMKVVETLKDLVREGGRIGVMSSGQGSIAGNEKGGNDVYRASKAALNMIMRSFAVRVGHRYSLFLLAPGWIKTELGGANASFTLEEVTPSLVDTIIGREAKLGLEFVDRFGKPVAW